MIWRLIELAFLAWIVARWLGRLFQPVPPAQRSTPSGPFASSEPASPTSMTLVRCAACGTHVPLARAAAIGTDGRAFCSEACRQRG